MDIISALKEAVITLETCGLANPRLDAEVLLSVLLNKERTTLYSHPEELLSDKELGEFQQWIEKRKTGEPVAYITGRKEFWSLPFEINRHVLVPRPETEILVEEVLKACSNNKEKKLKILEIGTGCGAICVSLASELRKAQITATDISQEAIAVAHKNAQSNGVESQPVSGKFDVIVSNPPYISKAEYELLPFEVRGYEPQAALLAGTDGTEFHREIVREGASYLKSGGWLFMEIGSGQKNTVENILNESNLYDNIYFRADYAGINRVSIARRVTTGG